MKFAFNLRKNQLPQWAHAYIDYSGLKRFIKNAALADFFASLDANIKNVDDFYNTKFQRLSNSLDILRACYANANIAIDPLDADEFHYLTASLLELRTKLRTLQCYANLNRRGFEKLSHKLDGEFPAAPPFLDSRVYTKPFATNHDLAECLQIAEKWLFSLGYPNGQPASSVPPRVDKALSSRVIPSLRPERLEALNEAIKHDIPSVLDTLLQEANLIDDQVGAVLVSPAYPRLVLALLQRCITHRALACCAKILPRVQSLHQDDDVFSRTCLHRLVISIARSTIEESEPRPAFLFPAKFPNRIDVSRHDLSHQPDDNESIQVLRFLLSQLNDQQHQSLVLRDSDGKLPIHYAAEFGMTAACDLLINTMREWGSLNPGEQIDSSSWLDHENMSPLHRSVANGHILTARSLLQPTSGEDFERWASIRKRAPPTISVLALATRNNHVDMIKLLLDARFDPNLQDLHGEAPLHIAARLGYTACAAALLNHSEIERAAVDIVDKSGWTPLFTSAANGSLEVVQLLLEAGANPNVLDAAGWSIKEHAALRGHMSIVGLLPLPVSLDSIYDTSARSTPDQSGPALTPPQTSSEKTRHQPIKETIIIVSLGSMDTRKDIQPVELDPVPISSEHSIQLNSALSVVVGAIGATGEPVAFDLPPQENITAVPLVFMTTDISKVKILFDIDLANSSSRGSILGRGVAHLSSLDRAIWGKRMNLCGDFAVPIVAANTLEPIGRVNFNFLVITPFSRGMSTASDNSRRIDWPTVIGHRGLGKNNPDWTFLQMGENTIPSFKVAKELGASYVELASLTEPDVQLTKDHVPVIYHDFLVSETGIDAPVHAVTEDQFLDIGRSRADNSDTTEPPRTRPRAHSAGDPYIDAAQRAGDARMAQTRDFGLRGCKSNSDGRFVKAGFTTLEDLLRRLPPDLGFNVEMKYPMLSEAQDEKMHGYAVELNEFVDKVLATVFEHAGDRKVVFSSFHPDLCIFLASKQRAYPVLFLTDAGVSCLADWRAQSLKQAVRFARRWGLMGIVSAAEPFFNCTRLVAAVKRKGLACVSYGTLNNDIESAKLQGEHGIDAVIVDRVGDICDALDEEGKGERRRRREMERLKVREMIGLND